MQQLFLDLKEEFNLSILSGDNEGEKEYLSQLLPKK